MNAARLSDAELAEELEQLHATRREIFRRGDKDALDAHTRRMIKLEQESLRRSCAGPVTDLRSAAETDLRHGRSATAAAVPDARVTARVWFTDDARPQLDEAAADGDAVVRLVEDQLVIGRVHGGQVEWIPQMVPLALVAAETVAGIGGGHHTKLATSQAPLLLAVEGVESALNERGG